MDYSLITKKATDFIKNSVKNANADGVIFGLSGGIDSATIAYLCKKAIGNHCLAMIMPNHEFTPESETDDGVLVATELKMKYIIRPINFISNLFTVGNNIDDYRDEHNMRLTIGNLNARIRANYLYYEGQKRNYLVVGTDDKSEHLIGYFTKFGDGACDILPIESLYKHEVKELASHLGVPDHIIRKQSSPHLWKNHRANKEIGLDYDSVDILLKYIVDQGMTPVEASKKSLIPLKTVERIYNYHVRSQHKRELPYTVNLKE